MILVMVLEVIDYDDDEEEDDGYGGVKDINQIEGNGVITYNI